MKSQATTALAYLDSLPPDRREAIQTVRRFILKHLDSSLQECMQYGVIAYTVPHSVWPHGTRTNPELPLMYMGLSSQKNDMVVYMLFLYENERERAWFEKAWQASGKKLHMKIAGMACCLRFKKVEDLSLDVIAEAMRRMPMNKYLQDHMAMLARLGKGPDGKPIKKGGAGAKERSTKAKRATPPPKKKTAKKRTVAVKRG